MQPLTLALRIKAGGTPSLTIDRRPIFVSPAFMRVLWRNIVSMSASRSFILLSCTVTVLPGTVTERGVTPPPSFGAATIAAGDCMPARVAPVSLWTDTGAVRCVTKAFSACPNQRTNSCAPHGAPLTYVTLSVRVFPLGGNTRVTRRVCYPPSVMVPRSA